MDAPRQSPEDDREAVDWERLVEAAREARERAHAPYSGYRVGAALELVGADGRTVTVTGCNVENQLLGLSVCAERVAVTRAVAEGLLTAGKSEAGAQGRPDGGLTPRALAVVTDSSPPAAPCGLCRETLSEFVHDLPILMVNLSGDARCSRLSELLPLRFELPRP